MFPFTHTINSISYTSNYTSNNISNRNHNRNRNRNNSRRRRHHSSNRSILFQQQLPFTIRRLYTNPLRFLLLLLNLHHILH
jgi:hypothetical protein